MPLNVEWQDSGLEPQCAPNPNYPDGVDVITGGTMLSCWTALPYPARRIGVYIVTCDVCGMRAGCTTAGRPDDPRSIRVLCKVRGRA